jgi:hypothetical protein
MTTYAITWREPDGRTFVGRLALAPRALQLDGRLRSPEGASVKRLLGYDDLLGHHLSNRKAERLDGRRALVLECHDGDYLVADTGLGAPVVNELADRLARLADRKETAEKPHQNCAPPRIEDNGGGPTVTPQTAPHDRKGGTT